MAVSSPNIASALEGKTGELECSDSFEKITDLDAEILVCCINYFQVSSGSCFLIKKRNGIAMKLNAREAGPVLECEALPTD